MIDISDALITYDEATYKVIRKGGKLIAKSETDQILHAKILGIVRDILIDNNINPILSGSGVLGYTRSGNFLPWVPGLTFIVRYEEINNKITNLIDIFTSKFDIVRTNTFYKSNEVSILALWLNYLAIEIQIYKLNGSNRERRLKSGTLKTIPNLFFNKTKPIVIHGEYFNIPYHTKSFLTHLYGNWRKVNRTKSQGCKASTFRVPSNIMNKLYPKG